MQAGREGHERRGAAPGVVAAATCVCLALALAAQALLDARDGAAVGLPARALAGGLFLAAAAALAVSTRRQPLETTPRAAPETNGPVHWLMVVLALLLGVAAFLRLGGNQFTPDGTLIWVGGLLLLLYAGWSGQPLDHPQAASAGEPAKRRWWIVAALAGIMALGAFFRFYRLAQIPLEMGCDLPLNQFNVQDVLDGAFPIFFPAYPGREGLFFYLTAPVAAVFGLSHLTIKATAAALGVLTLPAVYWLGRELYNREAGLWAAFLLAVSYWHIILTRVGYRSAVMPLVLALMCAALIHAFKTGARNYYLLAGLLLGLGMYSYNAFMVAPALVMAMVAAEWLAGRGAALRRRWRELILLVLVALYVFIPLGRYAYDEPGSYGYRAATRITSSEVELPDNVLPVLADNLWRQAQMFNVAGDGVFVSNVPDHRELGFVTAALFVLGLGLALARWRRGYNLTVLAVLVIMSLPSALSIAFPNEVPNANRAIGAVVAAVILPAAALTTLRRSWAAAWNGRARPLYVAVMVLLAGGLLAETAAVYPLYFRDYVWAQADHNYSISLTMAEAIDAAPEAGPPCIMVWPYWYDGNAVRAQLRIKDPDTLVEETNLTPGAPPLSQPADTVVVLLNPADRDHLRQLQETFPDGHTDVYHNLTGDESLIVFHGE